MALDFFFFFNHFDCVFIIDTVKWIRNSVWVTCKGKMVENTLQFQIEVYNGLKGHSSVSFWELLSLSLSVCSYLRWIAITKYSGHTYSKYSFSVTISRFKWILCRLLNVRLTAGTITDQWRSTVIDKPFYITLTWNTQVVRIQVAMHYFCIHQ